MTLRERAQQAHANYHAQQEAAALVAALGPANSDSPAADYYNQTAAQQQVAKNNKMLYIFLAGLGLVGVYLYMDSKPTKKKKR